MSTGWSVFIFQDEDYPRLVWSANRNSPLKLNATLELTEQGDLIWSTDTSGKNVSGLNLTETGDLVLFNTENSAVWESFHHPTDSLVVGQSLLDGMKLTASISDSNWTEGLFSILPTTHGFVAQLESNPPQLYYEFKSGGSNSNGEAFIFHNNGSLYLPTYDDAGNN
ncbi:hypothetical protein AAG906_007227 [Vitis piasezkii]